MLMVTEVDPIGGMVVECTIVFYNSRDSSLKSEDTVGKTEGHEEP